MFVPEGAARFVVETLRGGFPSGGLFGLVRAEEVGTVEVGGPVGVRVRLFSRYNRQSDGDTAQWFWSSSVSGLPRTYSLTYV